MALATEVNVQDLAHMKTFSFISRPLIFNVRAGYQSGHEYIELIAHEGTIRDDSRISVASHTTNMSKNLNRN